VSIDTIKLPLPGERVLALAPETLSEAQDWLLRRPNLFPGRGLTAATLEGRQSWASHHVSLRGQAFTAGVVRGLEAALSEGTSSRIDGTRLTLQQGVGLCVSGEDVRVPRGANLSIGDLEVVADPSVFAGTGSAGGGGGGLTSKVVGGRLADLIAEQPDALPRVGILVLQPVTADRVGEFDATDPCTLDGCGESVQGAFEDWRIGDGVRVLWYAWPEEWRALPPMPLIQTSLWRNLIAWEVFEAERALGADELLPWEHFGLPVALVGCDVNWAPLFLDRATVSRGGGRPRFSRMGGGAAGLTVHWRLPALWQARVEQLAEQIADQSTAGPGGNQPGQRFLRLPAFGLLPREVVELDPDSPGFMRCSFFPSSFQLDAVPMPQEQLDAAMGESAALGPVDLSSGGRIRLLVPVPQAVFEPRLLIREVIDPEFAITLAEFLLTRARHLGARQALRRRAAVLARGITGSALEVPDIDDDPDALESESLAPWGPPPTGGGHRSALADGRHEHGFEAASEVFNVAAGDRLSVWIYLDPDRPPRSLLIQWRAGDQARSAWWGENLIDLDDKLRLRAGELPDTGLWLRLEVAAADLGLERANLDGIAFRLYDGQATFAGTGTVGATGEERTWFTGRLPDDAVVTGGVSWQALTDNDLWAPFEPAGTLTPVDAGDPPAGGGHTEAAQEGLHQHYFENATSQLTTTTGESLFAWVFLDPTNPPSQLMLQWRAGSSWEHRAYWGASRIRWGTEGEASRLRVGALPLPGRWVRLEVPAADLGIEGAALNGMAFTLHDGAAAFGASGALPDAPGADERVWFAAKPPTGAQIRGAWQPIAGRDMHAPTAAGATGELASLAKLHADPRLAHLSEQERYQLFQRGVQGFVSYLKARADRADDLVDYGFVKVQTDIYRVRQLILGTTAATRLAVSPALASIAQADTAVASNERIASFFSELKTEQPVTATAAAAAGGTAPVSRRVVAAAPPPASPASRAGTSAGERTASVVVGASTGGRATGAGEVLLDIGLDEVSAAEVSGRADLGREVTPVLAVPRFTPAYVTEAAPIIGMAQVRTVSIAERLEAPKAKEAKDYTSATRYEAVRNLMQYADELAAADAGEVPGLFQGVTFHGVRGDPVLFYQSEDEVSDPDKPLPDLDDPDQQAVIEALPRSMPFTTFITQRWRQPLLLQSPLRSKVDESAQFSDGADLSDNTVALMRQVEGRVKLYREAIAAAEALLATLRRQAAGNESRLSAIGADLAEARHDVALTRALIAEEEARLEAINTRRAETLREHVRFVAYQRPREAELVISAPSRQLDPGLMPAPAPACLAEHQNAPEELRALLAVVREAPARWFVAARKVVDRLDRVDLLVKTVRSAQLRAQVMSLRLSAQPEPATAAGIGGAIAGLQHRRLVSVNALRVTATQVDPAAIASLSWSNARAEADKVISLGDLMDGEHGRGEVARRAASVFEDISRICACAHEAFSAVLPAIRLEWAQRMSQFDASPELANLASLPRFGELDYALRRSLQAFADWLFHQVDPREREARALINDLLRMGLLLASHAPINRIVSGRLPAATTAKPGIRLPITVAAGLRPRVGMQALVYKQDRVVARARVDDLGSGEVSATVLQVEGGSVDLAAETRIQLIEPESPVAMSTAQVRSLFRI
jgi:hypothetical protein